MIVSFVVFACVLSRLGVLSTPPEKCEKRWKKIGCFHDRIIPDRPLPNEILNHRDPINNNWDGHLINWKAWPQSLHALACRCAELTKERGHRYFGLQFYGECWTGPSTRYYRDGPSTECIGIDYKPCVDDAPTECVGKAFTNYIYDIQDFDKTPIPGGWSEWSSWTVCDKSCDGGVRARERTCTNPTPENGGEHCEGVGEVIEECNAFPCEPVCKKKLEIGIITDASTSVTAANYRKVKDFVIKLTTEFIVGEDGVHFGMIHYSWHAHLDFSMRQKEFWNPSALRAKILSSKYIYGGTSTDMALYLAESEFFCDGCVRPGLPKVLIVITDGKSSRGSDPMSLATKGLKEKGVTIISVGIGNKIDRNELLEIAEDKEHVFVLEDFKYLFDKLNDILKLSCHARKKFY